jgi:hypothetical protein
MSRPPEGLEPPCRCVCSSHPRGLPGKGREDLAQSIPVDSLAPCHAARPSLCRRGLLLVSSPLATSAGHAGVPKEREPRSAPRSPPPHSALRLWPYREAYPGLATRTDVGPRRSDAPTVFSRCPPHAPCVSSVDTRPPHGQRVYTDNPTPALQTREDPGAHARPNRGAPRSITAWPLRRRPCGTTLAASPSRGEFEP